MAVEASSIQVLSISDALDTVVYLLGVGGVVLTALLTLIYQAFVRRLDRIETGARLDNERSDKLIQDRLSHIDADLREVKKEVNSIWRSASRESEARRQAQGVE